MPYEQFQQLTDHGKHICREIVQLEGQTVLGAGFVSAIAEDKQRFVEEQKEQLAVLNEKPTVVPKGTCSKL